MTLNPLALYRRQKARKAFTAAFRRHQKAKASGDTRMMHNTRQALSVAQRRRLEVGA